MTIHFAIDQNIEEQLTEWQDYVSAERKKRIFPCITISREFGCEALPLAEALRKRLNFYKGKQEKWIILDKRLLEKIADRAGIGSAELDHVGNTHFIFQTMISIFKDSYNLDQFDAFQYIRKAVLYFARTGNSIIVGRGGASLTQDLIHCVNIRLVASMDFRIARVMRDHNIDESEAKKFVEKEQKLRDDFVRRFTDTKSLSDPHLYHLIINNEQHSPEKMAEFIESYLRINQFRTM